MALVLLLATSPARADGLYVGQGMGGARIEDELGRHRDGGARLRVALGYRVRTLSLELWAGLDLVEELSRRLATRGLDVKHAFPLGGPFEVYLRGSISGMRAGADLVGYSGRGLGFGTGLQVKGKAPLVALLFPAIALGCLVPDLCDKLGPRATFAAFIDQGRDFYRLHGPGGAIEAEITRWTFGIAVGSDF